jgi:hypothetical protein
MPVAASGARVVECNPSELRDKKKNSKKQKFQDKMEKKLI